MVLLIDLIAQRLPRLQKRELESRESNQPRCRRLADRLGYPTPFAVPASTPDPKLPTETANSTKPSGSSDIFGHGSSNGSFAEDPDQLPESLGLGNLPWVIKARPKTLYLEKIRKGRSAVTPTRGQGVHTTSCTDPGYTTHSLNIQILIILKPQLLLISNKT